MSNVPTHGLDGDDVSLSNGLVCQGAPVDIIWDNVVRGQVKVSRLKILLREGITF